MSAVAIEMISYFIQFCSPFFIILFCLCIPQPIAALLQPCCHLQLIISSRYCPNGELFDFIVSSGKLPEDEARKVFQQIVGGIELVPSAHFPALFQSSTILLIVLLLVYVALPSVNCNI